VFYYTVAWGKLLPTVFHVEKPTTLLPFSNVNEQIKEIKIMQRTKNKNELQSHYIYGALKRKRKYNWELTPGCLHQTLAC
jgi:hypothetical protein